MILRRYHSRASGDVHDRLEGLEVSYEFQMIALTFMRDWYQISAMSFTGEMREELKRRSETVQNLIDRMAYGGR